PIEAGMVTKAIRSAQTQVEQQNFEIRKNVLKYDEVLNQQRTVVYEERRRVLAGENIREQVEHMLEDVIRGYVDGATAEGYAEDWDLDKLWTAVGMLYPPSLRWQDLAESEEHDDITKDVLLRELEADAKQHYATREREIDEIIGAQGGMRELERQVLLQVMDRKWREHLYEMDYLKEGIGLRAMAQRDPLIEYRNEGFEMFNRMLDGIKEETLAHLFNVRVQAAEPQEQPAEPAAQEPARQAPAAASVQPPVPSRPAGRHAAAEPAAALPAAFGGRGGPSSDALSYSGPSEDGEAVRSGPPAGGPTQRTPSRNRPCPCGSGRKYKQCHGSPTAARH
ncbi:MAG: SEC-C domain-containing protein, partial [Pseudonocardia sp.]|nr:SEC-C domain-containing protein [Pseudonocardia sp.]